MHRQDGWNFDARIFGALFKRLHQIIVSLGVAEERTKVHMRSDLHVLIAQACGDIWKFQQVIIVMQRRWVKSNANHKGFSFLNRNL